MATEITPIQQLHAVTPDPGPRAAAPVSPAATNTATPAPAPEPSGSAAELAQAVAELARRFEAQTQTDLQFRLDREAGRLVVSVVDSRDGTVLRQLPSEVVLRIARHLEQFQAHLIEETA